MSAGSRLADICRFGRFSVLNFSVMLPLIGAAAVSPDLSGAQIAALAAVGLAFHIFGYVSNDVFDLPIDRTEPLRAGSPLVRGLVNPSVAMAIALLPVPLACAIHLWAGGSAAAAAVLMAGMGLGLIYNRYGKRISFPLLSDAVQGLAWVALALYGALTVERPLNGAVIWVAATVFVYVLMINGLHGGLRDVANDARHGARTTAIYLGARADAEGRVILPGAVGAYGLTLQIVLMLLGVAGIMTFCPQIGIWRTVAVTAIAAAHLVLFALGRTALRAADKRPEMVRAGSLHLFISLGAVLLPFALLSNATAAVAIAAAYAVPLLLRPSRLLASLWSLTRFHNAITGALYVLVAAYVAADINGLTAKPVLLGAVVIMLVIASANVVNDYRDAAADAIAKPWRAIPSGRVSRAAAGWLGLGLALLAVTIASTLGSRLTIFTILLIAVSAVYNYVLKETPLIGNATVGLLCAAILMYGAVAAGRVTPAVAIATAMTFLFTFAQEILYAIKDEDGDRLSGVRTTATALGARNAMRVFKILVLVFVLVSVSPSFLGVSSDRYLWAVIACTVVPALIVLIVLRNRLAGPVVARASHLSRVVWFSSIAAIVLLSDSTRAAGANPPPLRVATRQQLIEAMRAEKQKGYTLSATPNGGRFLAGVILHLARQAQEADHTNSTPILIDHGDYFAAFLAITDLTPENAPTFIRIAREYGEDYVIDYRRENVIDRILQGRQPNLAVNVVAGWSGPAASYTYEDHQSTPPLRVTHERVNSYRLLDFGDMLLYDDIHGIGGRALGGLLGLLFKIIGDGQAVRSFIAISSREEQVTLTTGRKAFITLTTTATVTREGHGEKGLPPQRPDLVEIEGRLKKPFKAGYAPLRVPDPRLWRR